MPILILSAIAAAYCMLYLNHCIKSRNALKASGAVLLTLICALSFVLAL